MTKAQYIKSQAHRLGIKVKKFIEILKRNKEEVVECDCGHKCCAGFIIKSK